MTAVPAGAPPVPPSSRDKILDVAEARFARAGFGGVGMREVADAAGLGKSSLFHHFASKETLYFEVIERTLERIAGAVEPALGAPGSATERLRATSDAMVDALAEHPTTAPLLLRSLFEMYPRSDEVPAEAKAVDALLERLTDRFQDLVREGIASGEFRDVSPPDATQTFIGAAVFHFASGDFGEELFGGDSLFSAQAVARRRDELREFLLRALVRKPL